MSKEIVKFVVAAVFVFGYLSSGHAQTIEKKTYTTAQTQIPPVIDGMLNDECWNTVEWGGDFIQRTPKENVPPSQLTSFKILYDDNNLYVFIKAYDSIPSQISKRLSRRDNFDGDRVTIMIDSYFDQQTAFSFTAMVSGTKGDELISQDGESFDDSWDPVWYLETTVDGEGWCAEMKIPFSQLRFGKKDVHTWGVQLTRQLFRKQEQSAWQFIPKGAPGYVHLFGELHGIQNIKPKRQIELMPYVLAKTERFQKEEGNPFLNGKSSSFSGGLDGKVAITNDFTLDFSVNPDFGQVEADPSEVNLTAFETYFRERRPLFVEGKNIYEFQPSGTIVINNFGADNLFYSRRIGRFPNYTPSSDTQYVKMPESTRILSALKISGKTRKGLSVGILESLTANEKAKLSYNGTETKESVEPFTNYFVGRVQQDFNKGKTNVGGIFTAVNRNIDNPALNFQHTAAYTGGIDFKHSWKERAWYFAGNFEFSNVQGTKEAITATQQSSARYFQRPDADYVSVDTTLTSLSGYGSTLKFGRTTNKLVQFETSVTVRSPGLEFNDIGFMRYTDLIHHGSWVALNWRDPFLIFNNFYLNTNYWMYWDFSGRLTSSWLNTNWHMQFKNRWNVNFNLTRQMKNISNDLLRGGPSIHMPGETEVNLNVFTDQSKKIMVYAGNYQGFGDQEVFRASDYYGGIVAQPMNALSVSLEPDYLIISKKLQYVQSIPGDGVTPQDGEERYLFAGLDQKTLLFTFRLNFTINPELSIEYYGQPFMSAGKYYDFKKITSPKANSFENRYSIFEPDEITYNAVNNEYQVTENGGASYTISNPDYNFRQFRSNLVVRWEYRPGSTIFLVWSQGRTSTASDGRFSFDEDINDLFTEQPHNVFLVKLSYWLPI